MAASLAKRLQLRAGTTLSLLNAPADVEERLKVELAGVVPASEGEAGAALLFVGDLADVRDKAPAAFDAVAAGGPVWIAYPKKSSGVQTDVDRDTLWSAVLEMGWAPVRQIAVDETWSAVRFRPEKEVGT
jgi:hypothetical protein